MSEGEDYIMFEHRDPTGGDFVTYELNADDFEFFQGDAVAPGSEIGIDIRSGSPVYLNCWGRVATAYYNPMNHSYLVMINRFARNPKTSRDPANQLLAPA
jgi:hypothetical protein